MLCDEVPCSGVQRPGEEGGEEEIEDCAATKGADEEVIEDDLDTDVDKVPDGRRL